MDRAWIWNVTADDLGDETAAERGHFGEDEVTVWIGWELGEGGGFTEVVHREGGEDRDNNVILADGDD